MWYPKGIVIADAKQVTTANATALVGIAGAGSAIGVAIDHQGPGILFYGLETVSAGDAGVGRFIFQYTSRDGNPMTSSGTTCTFLSVSATATGCLPINLSSASTFAYWVSCTAAASGTTIPNVRYWLTYIGGGAIGSGSALTGLGMLQG